MSNNPCARVLYLVRTSLSKLSWTGGTVGIGNHRLFSTLKIFYFVNSSQIQYSHLILNIKVLKLTDIGNLLLPCLYLYFCSLQNLDDWYWGASVVKNTFFTSQETKLSSQHPQKVAPMLAFRYSYWPALKDRATAEHIIFSCQDVTLSPGVVHCPYALYPYKEWMPSLPSFPLHSCS